MNFLNYEARAKIALAGGAFDWRETPIGRNDGGLLADAQKFLRPKWWKRTQPFDEQGREIIGLVERAGLGTLQIRDEVSEEFKRKRDAAIKLNDKPSEGLTGSELAGRQRDREGADEDLAPAENETINAWFSRLATAVDFAGPKKPFIDVVRSYASRFRGDSLARTTLDAKLVKTFLQQLAK
jgi:hypothetical protein